jgi:hypothetical protein
VAPLYGIFRHSPVELDLLFCNYISSVVGRDNSVVIATRYGLDGPGIESRWGGARFSVLVQTGPGAHPASCTMGTTSNYGGVKRPGLGVDQPPPLAPRLKKEYSYTSTPPLGLHGLFYGELNLYLS